MRPLLLPLLVAAPLVLSLHPIDAAAQSADTIALEVGSPRVDGRIFAPHAARVRRHVAGADSPVAIEWINELTLGDSAGRPVMRWLTASRRKLPNGSEAISELRQTYDAITLAPYGLTRTVNGEVMLQLAVNGTAVRGVQRSAPGGALATVDVTLDRPGFVASASDIVPVAAGLRAGVVYTAPVWGPGMTRSEGRIFSVIGKVKTDVEGTMTEAWAVEERAQADRRLLATWFLLTDSPYMVAGDVPLSDGRVQRMTEVTVPAGTRP
jgi:hypothetical protein